MTKMELFDLYNTNKKFKEYVDKYARAHNKPFPEDCFEHQIVKNYAESVRKEQK